jgi:hypothetical protein
MYASGSQEKKRDGQSEMAAATKRVGRASKRIGRMMKLALPAVRRASQAMKLALLASKQVDFGTQGAHLAEADTHAVMERRLHAMKLYAVLADLERRATIDSSAGERPVRAEQIFPEVPEDAENLYQVAYHTDYKIGHYFLVIRSHNEYIDSPRTLSCL